MTRAWRVSLAVVILALLLAVGLVALANRSSDRACRESFGGCPGVCNGTPYAGGVAPCLP